MRLLVFVAAGLCLAASLAGTAAAQAPPLSPPEIASCLCLHRAVDALGAQMSAKQQALNEVRAQLDRATHELDAARSHVDVNDPAAVAHFREMLAHHDALFERANGPAVTETDAAVARYNQRSQEYNQRCAGRPMQDDVVARVQATLACPAPY
jgi:hypothetical protein